MKIATINWSDVKGEGSVGFGKEFDELDRVTQLDLIQDALHALNEMYNEVLRESKKK